MASCLLLPHLAEGEWETSTGEMNGVCVWEGEVHGRWLQPGDEMAKNTAVAVWWTVRPGVGLRDNTLLLGDPGTGGVM